MIEAKQGRMKTGRIFALIVALTLGMAVCRPAAAGGVEDFFKKFQKALGGSGALTEKDIIAGLKEALQVGTANAVHLVSGLNGYYLNPQIKILLPESIRNSEKILRYAGFGATVDRFELSMNRAAERAAPRAKALFWDAIGQMTFADARRVLDGPDDAATRYFEQKTASQLQTHFKPIVKKSMAEVGVTRTYQQLEDKLRSISFAQSAVFDLDQYVTEKAIEGLFVMLAKEEAAIRKDPAARVTELLEKVFGSPSKQ